MTLDPRWSVFLSLGLAILAFFATAGSQFADLGLDPATTKKILAVITLLIGVGNSVNAVLGAIPSKSGPDAAKSFYLGPKPPQP